MDDDIARLFASLQLLRAYGEVDPRQRWYVRSERDRRWRGPFEAVEVAYLINSRALGSSDLLADETLESSWTIGEQRSLRRWQRGGEETRRALRQGLIRAIRRRRGDGGTRSSGPTGRVGLTLEQLEAFRLLDLQPGCSLDEARRRHRRLAQVHHPDRGGDLRRMKAINRAFDIARQALCA